MKKAIAKIDYFLGTTNFSYVIIGLFVLQGLFIALLTTWIVFDERFHFGLVTIYTDHLWPVVYDQPVEYDKYRDLAGEGSKLYHYLMSFPLRGIELFTQDTILQLKILRLLNVAMFAVGLYWFLRLFDLAKISRRVSNLGLFVFIMIPVVPWVAGSVNYDNFVFMLTPIFLYLLLQIIFQKRAFSIQKIALLVVVGLMVSLAKFTFIPIFGLGIVAVFWVIFRSYRHNRKIKVGPLKWSASTWIVGAALIFLSALFVQTYIVNFLQYGTPRPDCRQTLGLERCLRNSVISKNEAQVATKDDRPMVTIVDYSIIWSQTMLRTAFFSAAQPDRTVPSTDKQPLPIMHVAYAFLFMVAAVSIIRFYQIRDKKVLVILAFALFCTLFILITGYIIYEKYHAYRAVQGRYLLPAVLVVGVVGLHYARQWFFASKFKYKLLTSYLIMVVLLTQGGGVLTYIMNSEQSWYWNPDVGNNVQELKRLLQPVIKERIE